MGLNPFRGANQPPKMADYLMVGGAVLITVVAVVWGFVG